MPIENQGHLIRDRFESLSKRAATCQIMSSLAYCTMGTILYSMYTGKSRASVPVDAECVSEEQSVATGC